MDNDDLLRYIAAVKLSINLYAYGHLPVSRQEAVLQLLKEAIQKRAATSKGFLIDGYPRELEQAKRFEADIGAVDWVIYLEVNRAAPEFGRLH